MNKYRLGWKRIGIIVLASLPPIVFATDAKDHPLISSYPGAEIVKHEEAAHQSYRLITGVAADSLDFESVDLAGRLTRISYQNPTGRSTAELLANYEQAIAGAGGEILFTCREKACGPAYAGSRWGRFNGTIHLPGVGGYIAARITGNEATAYIAIGVAKTRHQITVLEVDDMETGLVRVDPDALGQELDRLGHVAIPGVHFETGKARLKPESDEALSAMAQILKARPGMKVWVVGHTDSTGSFALNASLSEARARTVAETLVDAYGIDAARVEGHGVGPLSPRASNAKESGRGQNRRVELVVRP
ncbi:MAG: OmpA family protein [Algiphilus sp.]